MNLDVQSLHGWCSQEKAVAMAELIKTEKPFLCVEIGVFGGRSLIAQGLALRELEQNTGHKGVVWGIDPWTIESALEGENGPENDKWWSSQDLFGVRDSCLAAIDRFHLWPWVRIAIAKSEDMDDTFRGIDILHIDGNHSEECSVADVKMWLPSVRKGGLIWFDDTDWKSTDKAVKMLNRGCKVVSEIGACRLYKRNG